MVQLLEQCLFYTMEPIKAELYYHSYFGDSNAITSNAIGKKSSDPYGASLALVMINIQHSSHALAVKKRT